MTRKSQRVSGRSARMEVESDDEAGPSSAPKASHRQSQSQRTQRNIDDDMDEVPATPTRRRGDLPEDEENHVLGTLVKFLLSAAASKNAIKHTDIKTYGIPDHAKYYQSFMTKARDILNETFGYKLINLGGQKWIIVNAHNQDQIRLQPEDAPSQTLLFLVLAHIFMSGGDCREDNLIQFLKNMKIWREHGAIHPYFGNVEELVQKQFVQQIYLIRTKISENDNEAYDYVWGERATEELDPKKVIEFVSKVFRGRPASSWAPQYRKAYKLDRPGG